MLVSAVSKRFWLPRCQTINVFRILREHKFVEWRQDEEKVVVGRTTSQQLTKQILGVTKSENIRHKKGKMESHIVENCFETQNRRRLDQVVVFWSWVEGWHSNSNMSREKLQTSYTWV